MNPHCADQQLCAGPAKSLLGINLQSAVTEPLIFSAAAVPLVLLMVSPMYSKVKS